ncbi:MAG: hypothetical protein IKH26_01630 [Bacteroidaceae bacterium]|nr:hypothetical protein [Bacteroidaceae bacterium]
MKSIVKLLSLTLLVSFFSLIVHGQEASEALISMVKEVHSACPRAFVPGVKLASVEIDDEYVVCTFTAEESVLQRGGLNSERNKESMKLSLLKNFRRMSRTSILRQMADEVADCDMGVKGVVVNDGTGDSLEVVITNDELREATGRPRPSDF